jgi:3-deoxy-D-manno-octulosonate 8-phosphate phosphatase KdsC-like HAD superfamily phosphatase
LAIDLKTQELLEARGYKPEDYPSFQSMKRQATLDLGYKEVSYITVEATRNPVELGEMKRLIFPESGSKKEFTPKRALTEMRKQGGHKKGSEREIGDSDFLHDSRARAITSEKYQSLDKLVSERNRVQERSQYTHLEDEFSDMFDNTINDVEKVFKESFGDRMKPYKDGTKTYTSNLNRLDTLQVIQHILLGEKIPDFMQLNTSDIVKIKQLVKPLEKMGREMPTAYFESKPNRIVNIGEFKTAIVPKGDTKSIERLKKLGIKNIIEYKDQEGYLSAFKKNPELFFSKAIIPTGGLLGEDAISVEEEDEGEGLLSVKKKVEKPMNGVLDGVKPTKTVPSVTNNNPGNIKATNIKWDGMTGKNGDFVEFDNPENGIRALTRDLTNKRKRGLDTITKIITVYAPPSENDTKSYIKDVANDMGLSATDKLSDKNMYKMIKAMTKHEGGKEALKHFTDAIIKKGMKSAYKNKYQKFN